ncbi:MAG: hypothetical protein LBN02_09005 [Oscillospiraceae bacterium]|jgi:DNA mismatch repair ATPase MutS|nr:hypothetical protein [Oscillospiraceae bacterium]
MAFYSILYPTREKAEAPAESQAECFKDLNLGQVFDYIFKARVEYSLETYYFVPLQDAESVYYRQAVLRELENPQHAAVVAGFSSLVYMQGSILQSVHDSFDSAETWRNNYLTRGQLLDSAERYCAAIDHFANSIMPIEFESEGLRAFKGYVDDYRRGAEFKELLAHAKRIRDKLSEVQYVMHIKEGKIRVKKYDGEREFSESITGLFDKFRQGETNDYASVMPDVPDAPQVEAQVLDMVASYYKEAFNELDTFCRKYYNFIDETLLRFSREIQFYLGWNELIAPLREQGLPFCYPKVAQGKDKIFVSEGYDLALAYKRHGEGIVTNDFELNYPERLIMLTGPNQGGKTTFTRAFGQTHYVAALGLSVPGRDAALFLFDRILSHFGSEEDLNTQSGQLQSDLYRLKAIYARATDRSLILINEIFSSTTLADALPLGRHMMEAIRKIGGPSVVVTFLDELYDESPQVVSMMSLVNPEEPGARSFKIVRKPPDGMAFALYIAARHGLTYDQLQVRFGK